MNSLESAQQFNKIFQEYNLNELEIKQYFTMKKFERISKSYKQFMTLFRKNEDPRKAKYWKVFSDTLEIYKHRPIDYELFFIAQFEERRKDTDRIIPNFLKAQASLDRYKKFLDSYSPNEKDKVRLENEKFKAKQLYTTKVFINKWLEAHEFEKNNYSAFFEYRDRLGRELPNTFIFVGNQVSRSFCVLSKSFGKLYFKLAPDCQKEYLTIDEIRENRNALLNYKRVIKYTKHLFGEKEIDWSWTFKAEKGHLFPKESGDIL